jgi:hypothetical protein
VEYRLTQEAGPRDAEWVLAWDDTILTLSAPEGLQVLETPTTSAHRVVNLDELYAKGKVSLLTPSGPRTFRKHPPALSAVRWLVERGLVSDPEFCAEYRRESLMGVPIGLIMFVMGLGLFGLYCWYTWSAPDPQGQWFRWFGWLIGWVLMVLLAVGLAGPLVAFAGLRRWFRMWRVGRRATLDTVLPVEALAEVRPGLAGCDLQPWMRLECRRCASVRIEKLPPSSISPHAGYKCGECGTIMRAPQMLFPYLIVFMLGTGLASLFIYLMLGYQGDHGMPARGFWLFGLGLICAWYALRQLTRPAPRKRRVQS